MKNENVPFDRRPSEQSDLQRVHRVIEENPDEIKLLRGRPRLIGLIVAQEPGNDHDLIDEAKEQQNDDHVVVQGVPKVSIEEKKIQREDRAE